jgi:hypothetical protein
MSTISCAAIELGIIAVMVRHSARMIAATLLIAACMFLPFLPGEYDGLAVTLSTMSQLFGMTGLLLVPLGAIWLGYELRMRAPKAGPGRAGIPDTGSRWRRSARRPLSRSSWPLARSSPSVPPLGSA